MYSCIQNIVYFDQISVSAQLHAKHYLLWCYVTKWFWFDSRCFLVVSVFWTRWVFGSICVLCCYLNSKCRSWHGQTGALFWFCLLLLSSKCFPNTRFPKPKLLYTLFVAGSLRDVFFVIRAVLFCPLVAWFFFVRADLSDWTREGSAHASNACNHASWKTSVDWAKWRSLPRHLSYG